MCVCVCVGFGSVWLSCVFNVHRAWVMYCRDVVGAAFAVPSSVPLSHQSNQIKCIVLSNTHAYVGSEKEVKSNRNLIMGFCVCTITRYHTWAFCHLQTNPTNVLETVRAVLFRTIKRFTHISKSNNNFFYYLLRYLFAVYFFFVFIQLIDLLHSVHRARISSATNCHSRNAYGLSSNRSLDYHK